MFDKFDPNPAEGLKPDEFIFYLFCTNSGLIFEICGLTLFLYIFLDNTTKSINKLSNIWILNQN